MACGRSKATATSIAITLAETTKENVAAPKHASVPLIPTAAAIAVSPGITVRAGAIAATTEGAHAVTFAVSAVQMTSKSTTWSSESVPAFGVTIPY